MKGHRTTYPANTLKEKDIGVSASKGTLGKGADNMAIVKEWKTEHGATIRINDAAYRDKTPEELEKRKAHANATICRLLREQMMEKAEKGESCQI